MILCQERSLKVEVSQTPVYSFLLGDSTPGLACPVNPLLQLWERTCLEKGLKAVAKGGADPSSSRAFTPEWQTPTTPGTVIFDQTCVTPGVRAHTAGQTYTTHTHNAHTP